MTKRTRGLLLAGVGASFWGGSGAAAQYLFHDTPMTTTWLVAVRLLGAGLVLTLVSWLKNPGVVKGLVTQRWARWQLIAFALFGTLNSQLTYFLAVRYSNAPTHPLPVDALDCETATRKAFPLRDLSDLESVRSHQQHSLPNPDRYPPHSTSGPTEQTSDRKTSSAA